MPYCMKKEGINATVVLLEVVQAQRARDEVHLIFFLEKKRKHFLYTLQSIFFVTKPSFLDMPILLFFLYIITLPGVGGGAQSTGLWRSEHVVCGLWLGSDARAAAGPRWWCEEAGSGAEATIREHGFRW